MRPFSSNSSFHIYELFFILSCIDIVLLDPSFEADSGYVGIWQIDSQSKLVESVVAVFRAATKGDCLE